MVAEWKTPCATLAWFCKKNQRYKTVFLIKKGVMASQQKLKTPLFLVDEDGYDEWLNDVTLDLAIIYRS